MSFADVARDNRQRDPGSTLPTSSHRYALYRGNHALAIGAARGAAQTTGRMGYLSVDAHLDTAPSWAGEIYSSGCPTMRAAEIPNVDPGNVVVFSVHGWLNPRDQVRAAADNGVRWFGMDQIEEMGVEPA